jgi:NAD-dependent SIR2 family protein deacetylase
VQDFRSEDGLYSLIQAQYDKSLENPPWEQANTFDIDDRPRKRKRPSYFYEVVAPDGNVVGVIDDEQAATSPKRCSPKPKSSVLLPSSSPLSTRSTTPSLDLSDSDHSAGRTLRSQSSVGSTTSKSDTSEIESQAVNNTDDYPFEIASNDAATTESECVSRSRKTSPITSRPPDSSYKDEALQYRHSKRGLRSNSPMYKSTEKDKSFRSSFQQTPLPGTRRHTLQTEESSFVSSTSSSDDELPATQSSQSSRTSLPNMKGRDLFDSMIWTDPFTTSIFYMFISSLRQKIQMEVKSTTEAHDFIRVLRDGGRLVRNYTQNIDCLEERLGLCTELTRGPGNRSRFHTKYQREARPCNIDEQSPYNGGVEVVLLHGSLANLRCGICGKLSSWNEEEREAATLAGQAPDCPSCTEYNAKRTGRGRRGLAVGRLRPDIVLYGEEHPHANQMGPLITHDLSLGPDVLLIMGTSLRVHGLKVMIREFAKAVHTRGGQVVFINRTKPSESTWGDVIDYWVEWDCDAWVLDLKRRRQDIWLPQGAVEEQKTTGDHAEQKPKKVRIETVSKRQSIGYPNSDGKKARLQCLRDDKMNGVFVTFKILDTLRRFRDAHGEIATRSPKFDKSGPRMSLPAPQPKKSVSKQRTKSMATPISLPSEPRPIKQRPRRPTKKQLAAEDAAKKASKATENENYWRNGWERLCRLAPGNLPAEPPLETLKSRSYHENAFFSNSTSNHMPFLYGGIEMNLTTHPPTGLRPKECPSLAKIPPVPKPSVISTNHTYVTRSSQRYSTTDTIVVKSTETPTHTMWSSSGDENTITVTTGKTVEISLPSPPASGPSSDPITSEFRAGRIKRISSIDNILSSPEDGKEVWHDAQDAVETGT